MRIAVPDSMEEQDEIVSYLTEKCERIDAFISEKQQLLLDLDEYKKAFIFECVTGKRKVV